VSIPNCFPGSYLQDLNHRYQEMTAPLNHCNVSHGNKFLPSIALLRNPGVAPNHVVNDTTTTKSHRSRGLSTWRQSVKRFKTHAISPGKELQESLLSLYAIANSRARSYSPSDR